MGGLYLTSEKRRSCRADERNWACRKMLRWPAPKLFSRLHTRSSPPWGGRINSATGDRTLFVNTVFSSTYRLPSAQPSAHANFSSLALGRDPPEICPAGPVVDYFWPRRRCLQNRTCSAARYRSTGWTVHPRRLSISPSSPTTPYPRRCSSEKGWEGNAKAPCCCVCEAKKHCWQWSFRTSSLLPSSL